MASKQQELARHKARGCDLIGHSLQGRLFHAKNRFHKAKDGRYTYSVTDIAGKRHRIISRKGEGRGEFIKRCEKLDKLATAEIRIETMDELFNAFVEQYLAVYNSKADREVTEHLYRHHVSALIGHRKISDIHRTDAYNVLSASLKKGLAPSTIKRYVDAFHALQLGD